MPGETKREKIILAAEQLFRERRIHELTMDDVAEAASVSKGTIYNHFKNKDDLLFQIATQGFEELCSIAKAIPECDSFQEELILLCEHVTEFFKRRRATMRMIYEHEGRFKCFSGSMKDRWRQEKRKLVHAISSIFNRGVDSGNVRNDIPADLLATMLLGLLRARGQDYADRPESKPDVSTVVDIFIKGIGTA